MLASVPGCAYDPSGLTVRNPLCGDGKLDRGENCDDGNLLERDGCSPICQEEEGWQCAGAPSECITICGDGLIIGKEACDDGNPSGGDGCSEFCEVEPGWACVGEPSVCAFTCGNGLLDPGEECDDHNLGDGDGCSVICRVEAGWACTGEPSICVESCGNGVIEAGELCDDDNIDPDDGCSPSCVPEPGWVCTGEPSVCVLDCGDGVIAGTEACDDGNIIDNDGCSSTCALEPGWLCLGEPTACTPVCGDGVLVGTEPCDDGNTTPGDGCSEVCVTEPGYQCTGQPSVCQTLWYDPAWLYRKAITIDHTRVNANLFDFPVLINLNDDPDLDDKARTDGFDILFADFATGARLSHEIQWFDDFWGDLIAWVKVPLVSSTQNTVIYMYYGNPNAADQQNAADVWSNGYEAVLHLRESGAGLDNEFLDSSGNGHHGTGGGLAGSGSSQGTPTRIDGLFDYAQDFSDGGTPDRIRLNLVADQTWTEITVQAWIRPDDGGDDRIFAKTWGTGADQAVWQLGKSGNNKIRLRTETAYADFAGGTTLPNGTWTQFAFTWTAGGPGAVVIYQNGSIDLTGSLNGAVLYTRTPDVQPTIGNTPAGDRGFDGRMQEVRLSYVARSTAWLLAEYYNQMFPDTFYTVGPEESP